MTLMNDSQVTIAGRYKIARVAAGLNQADIAKAVGVTRQSVGDWEAGRTEPSASKLILLARATNQPLDWFAEGLILDDVRPKGLEPLTFWFGADSCSQDADFDWIEAERQVYLDSESRDNEVVR